MLVKVRDFPEYDNHDLVTYVNDNSAGLHGYIAIHRNNSKYPSFGATRYWEYDCLEDGLKDALRLSKTMSHKAALAGLKCGGAKAVIVKNSNNQKRKDAILASYAKKVNSFGGSFVTGTDVGILDEDVKKMKRTSPYFVGTKTDPARYTALGVFLSMQECIREVFGKKNLNGRSVAIQGLGKTGFELLKLVAKDTDNIFVSEINPKQARLAKKAYPKVKFISSDEMIKKDVDVFAPCAMYHAINKKNVGKIKCKIVCGSANNQLENDGIGELLHKWSILYAPDYVANAGGLISVVDEYENGNHRVKRVTKNIEKVKKNTKKIINESKKKKKATNLVANRIAKRKLGS